MNLHENNRWLITAGKDRKVQVWSLNSGKKLRSWKPTDSVSQDIEVYKIDITPYADVGEMTKKQFNIRKQNAELMTNDSFLERAIFSI